MLVTQDWLESDSQDYDSSTLVTPELHSVRRERKSCNWHHKCFAAFIFIYFLLFSFQADWAKPPMLLSFCETNPLRLQEALRCRRPSLAKDLWTGRPLLTVLGLPCIYQHKLLFGCHVLIGNLLPYQDFSGWMWHSTDDYKYRHSKASQIMFLGFFSPQHIWKSAFSQPEMPYL